jgi:hypothetical protein
MAKNENLHKAAKEKDDEFYTQLSDIEKEIKHYKEHFKDKIVFCNCDNPEWSNFWKYFSMNFKYLGLKKLIATHYRKNQKSYKLEMIDSQKDFIKTNLETDGDFRSDECIEILKEADIIVSNPPFSLFREYIQQLNKHGKQFLVIGNNNSISYNEIFKLIKENKLWLGISPRSMNFILPDKSKKNVNACWYTNLTHKKRSEKIILDKRYNPEEYLNYDNYNAINVDKTKDIPMDYEGIIGVPITFMDKYNPEQFKIIGKLSTTGIDEYNFGYPYINGVKKFARILIKHK